MALFGSSRDISVFRHLNKELINDIISQEVDYYQLSLNNTTSNVYGESPDGKTYYSPVRFACLIVRNDQTWNVDDQLGSDVNQITQFGFFRDILVDLDLIPKVGDIINWNGNYWEVDSLVENQLFAGKNPDHNKNVTPEWGSSISIQCNTHYARITRLQIEKGRSEL
jgi:hypothetical protein